MSPATKGGSVSNAEAWALWLKTSGRRHPDDQPVPYPPGSQRVVQAFWELSRQRGSNGWAPQSLSWQDIDAWCRHTGTTLSVHERDLLQDLDGIWMRLSAEASAPDADNDKTRNGGRR